MKRPVKPFLVEVKRSRSELGPVKAPAFRLQETAPIPQGGALNHRHAAASALFEPVARDAPAPSPQAAPGQGRILPSLVAMTPPAEIAVSIADEPQAEAKPVRRQNRKTAANGALKNGVDLEMAMASNAPRPRPAPVSKKPPADKRAVESSPRLSKPAVQVAANTSGTLVPPSIKIAEPSDWAPGQRWKKRLRYLRPQ